MTLALMLPPLAFAEAWDGEVEAFLDEFEQAVIDKTVVPFMLLYTDPAVSVSQAAIMEIDVDALNTAARNGYRYAAPLTTIETFVMDRTALHHGTSDSIQFATIPYLLDITLEGFPELPATCNTLAVWTDDGTTYAHIFGPARTDALVQQVVAHSGVMLATAKPCPAVSG